MTTATLNATPSRSLSKIIDGPIFKGDHKILELLHKVDTVVGVAANIVDFPSMSIRYAGAAVTTLTGYPVQEMIDGGTRFIVSITDPADLPQLVMQQGHYVQMAKAPGFSPTSNVIHQYNWNIRKKDGSPAALGSLGVMLSYSDEMDFGVGVGALFSASDALSSSVEVRVLLSALKRRHNEIYSHTVVNRGSKPYPIHHVSELTHQITVREREVLGMLAQGKSTDEISRLLTISPNTVESHRKKLLSKFAAKNSAELINKASKIFWLESYP